MQLGEADMPSVRSGHRPAYASTHPPEYRRGFLDGIGTFVSMVLEGRQINPETWEVLCVWPVSGSKESR